MQISFLGYSQLIFNLPLSRTCNILSYQTSLIFSFVFSSRLHPGINNLSISHLNPHHNLINTMSSKQPTSTSKSSASVTDKARHTGSSEEKAGSGGSSRNVRARGALEAVRATARMQNDANNTRQQKKENPSS